MLGLELGLGLGSGLGSDPVTRWQQSPVSMFFYMRMYLDLSLDPHGSGRDSSTAVRGCAEA